MGGVTGVAVNANGVATGVLGRSSGSGPGVSGLAAKDSGVLGFHGDPRLNETTVGNDGAVAGVFGASDVGAGVVGYSRNPASFGVIAFGGLPGAGQYRPGLVLDARESSGNRLAVALMGKVLCKVDARCEAVAVGDLLTSSATPGHAMKAADPGRAFGAVIGKALAPLTSGKGLIPILVALQ